MQVEHRVDAGADRQELVPHFPDALVSQGIVLPLPVAVLSASVVAAPVPDLFPRVEPAVIFGVELFVVASGVAIAVAAFVGTAFNFGDEFFGTEVGEVLGDG